MKSNLFTVVCLYVLMSQVECQRWVLVWADEFNGSGVDQSKWNFDIGNGGGWGNNELEYYTNRYQNIKVENGKLVITALREDYAGFQYTSAKIHTHNKFAITYGKFEASIKLPYGQGIWPAFWMLGNDIDQVGWPACGEIDIMEYIGREPNNIYGTIHMPGFDIGSHYSGWGWSDSFHVYGVNWQPDFMDFYIDGNVYARITRDSTYGHWVFNKDHYIILNLAVGGNWPGYPDESTRFPQNLTVDWVRVYEADWSQEQEIE